MNDPNEMVAPFEVACPHCGYLVEGMVSSTVTEMTVVCTRCDTVFEIEAKWDEEED